MKKFYYYQFSDDGGQTWTDGDGALSLLKCVDRSRQCPYKIRILDQDDVVISKSKIDECLKEIAILEKIFQ